LGSLPEIEENRSQRCSGWRSPVNAKKARDFVASPDLKETMAEAGVIHSPTFYFLESAEPLRVMGTGWIELLGLPSVK